MMMAPSIQSRIKAARRRAAEAFKRIYHGEEVGGRSWNMVINVGKVFFVAARKFIRDDCFTKASAITYTITLSLVPTLTVALSIYSLFGVEKDKKALFERIAQFMVEHNIRLNIYPIFDTILRLVENAGKIGGISAAVMVISATAMLRSLENSMNDIWKVRSGRPLLLKIVYYWAALTLGPIMLVAATAVATQLSSVLSSPSLRDAAVTQGRLWVVGDRAAIFEQKGANHFERMPLDFSRIDYDNQRAYAFNAENGTVTEQEEGRLEPLLMKKIKFHAVQFLEQDGWIAGGSGTLLITSNGGSRWDIRTIGSISMNDIFMVTPRRGFVAADRGVVISTRDGWSTMQATVWNGYPDFTSIAFEGERGIITGTRGTILVTDDGGAKWAMKTIDAAKRRDRLVNLSAVCFDNEGGIWIAGDAGMLLYSNDDGTTWQRKQVKEIDLRAVLFETSTEGYVAGENGLVLHTSDGGLHWKASSLPTVGVNRLVFDGGRLLAIGDAGTVMASRGGAAWVPIMRGKRFGYLLINFFAPFVFIWILFLLVYLTLPNAPVSFKPAALGASFTAAVWVIFILGFIVYVKAFAEGTFAIYGALAAVPILLLLIYASSLIILFGAEVSYVLMYPNLYQNLKRALADRHELLLYRAIAILHQVYRKFESGKGATTMKDLRGAADCPPEEMEAYLRIFGDEGFILRTDDGSLIPALRSDLVPLNRVIDAVMIVGLDLPAPSGGSRFRRAVEQLFKKIEAARHKAVGRLTLRDLIEMDG